MDLKEIVKIEGNDEKWNYRSFLCHIKRNDLLSWCGYVYLPLIDNYTYILENINVHGGITWRNNDSYNLVIGFDCSHYDDYTLLDEVHIQSNSNSIKSYRTKEYAKLEVEKMLDQILEKNLLVLRDLKLTEILDK